MSQNRLLGEPSTADLGEKVAAAWRDFAHSLAGAVSGLAGSSRLDLTLDPTATGTGDATYGVSVQRNGEGLTGLAVGNAELPEGFRLGRPEVAAMVALGWSPPGVLAGSGDRFGVHTVPIADGGAESLANMVTRTLRDVYGAPHPAFLVYAVYDETGSPLPDAPLVLARHSLPEQGEGRVNLEGLELADRVRLVVASLMKTEPDELSMDKDGDIGIRAGSAMVFVRVKDNPPLVDVFSPVLTDISPNEKLFMKLSDLTNRMPIGRLYCTSGTVWASIPVFGRDFQPTHLLLAIQVMTGLADELDDRLHGEFGGKRFFGDGDKQDDERDERIGQYL